MTNEKDNEVTIPSFAEEVDKKVEEILPLFNGLSAGHIEAILERLGNSYKLYPIQIT